MKTLAVANQKGGVGKSTLSVHLAYAALEAGLRVLLVDMDNQASLSMSFPASGDAAAGLLASHLFRNLSDDFFPYGNFPKVPEKISDHLSIIRADDALLAVDKANNDVIRLPAKALRCFVKDYDLVLIDTPPLLGTRLMAALSAADFVLTPVSIGLFELAGVADLMKTIQVVRTQGFNPRLQHIGILPVKTNNRSKAEQTALDGLRARYGKAILPHTLPERAAVRKAVAMRQPVWKATHGDGHLKAAREWREACDAILIKVTQ